jgi:hypothetical protein
VVSNLSTHPNTRLSFLDRSMRDVDGPFIMTTIYEHLFSGESEFLNPDDVAYALDDAVQKLRRQGVHPRRWAPFIHVGI